MGLKERVEVLAAEVDTEATRTSRQITSLTHRGLILLVDVSNELGAPTYTPSLQAKRGATWATIWTAAAAISADGLYTYLLYPGTAGANYTEYVDMVLPQTYRVVLTYAGTPSTDNADTAIDAEHLP
jgi:hypothetical protein